VVDSGSGSTDDPISVDTQFPQSAGNVSSNGGGGESDCASNVSYSSPLASHVS